MPDYILTQDAVDKLKEELNMLSTIKRREIANRIQTAKDLGDLSENAEYSDAKDTQALNEGRILEIQHIVKNATISTGAKKGQVGLGSTLRVRVNGAEKDLQIVSFNEADPIEGKISNESPLGQVLIGKKECDSVDFTTPRGDVVKYEVIKIS